MFSKHPLFKILTVFLALIVAALIYVWMQLNAQQTIDYREVMIDSGSSSAVIASQLASQDIISSARYFRLLARLTGDDAKLKPGLYRFTGKLNMFEVMSILKAGKVEQFKVTIPEGLRTDEMLALLAKRTSTSLHDWEIAMKSITQNSDFEGVFLPETYLYSKPVNPKFILQQMFDARAKVEAQLAAELHWSEEDIKKNRIIASVVEKETALPHERVWVSAAIHNRLRKHMPLQMDPTVIYGMYRTLGAFSGNIQRKDLRTDTPWNTYTRRGLPITPICNPSAASLRAAAYPSDVAYLYFVADGTGGHAFASTLDEHNRNVQNWIKIERNNNK